MSHDPADPLMSGHNHVTAAAREAAHDEARIIGRRTIRGVIAAFVVFGLLLCVTGFFYDRIGRQACQDRREARDAVAELVLFVVGPDPVPGETPQRAGLRALVLPGGKLAPIDC